MNVTSTVKEKNELCLVKKDEYKVSVNKKKIYKQVQIDQSL